jgi:hypothetical protein
VLPVRVEYWTSLVLRRGRVAVLITVRLRVVVDVPDSVENRIVDTKRVDTVAVENTVALLI